MTDISTKWTNFVFTNLFTKKICQSFQKQPTNTWLCDTNKLSDFQMALLSCARKQKWHWCQVEGSPKWHQPEFASSAIHGVNSQTRRDENVIVTIHNKVKWAVIRNWCLAFTLQCTGKHNICQIFCTSRLYNIWKFTPKKRNWRHVWPWILNI